MGRISVDLGSCRPFPEKQKLSRPMALMKRRKARQHSEIKVHIYSYSKHQEKQLLLLSATALSTFVAFSS